MVLLRRQIVLSWIVFYFVFFFNFYVLFSLFLFFLIFFLSFYFQCCLLFKAMSVPFVKSNSSTESIKLIPEISKIPDLLTNALDPALVYVGLNFSCRRGNEKKIGVNLRGVLRLKFNLLISELVQLFSIYMCS